MNPIIIIAGLALAVASAILYRMGGAAGYNTKFRDFGCPTVAVITALIIGLFHWSLMIVWPVCFAVMTTYWKRKGQDANWYHWWTTGLMYAVAFLPVCYFLSRIEAFVFFTIFLSTATAIWSALVKNVVWEECGRGVILILAQAAFLIFK